MAQNKLLAVFAVFFCCWLYTIGPGPVAAATVDTFSRANTNEEDAIAFLKQYDQEYGALLNAAVIAQWNYETNLTDENANIMYDAGAKAGAYYEEASKNASVFDSTNFSDSTRRQLNSLNWKNLNSSASDELGGILSEMGRIYGSYKACRANPVTGVNECLALEPELTYLMAQNGNYDDHLWAWQSWHNGVGRQLRTLYLRYVELKNAEAQLNGFQDYGDQWRQKYETTEMETIVQDLYAKMEPLYKQLHAYIRRKLYIKYPGKIDLKGPLPAHLLSDMWGRFWVNLNEISQPYPNKPSIDPTPAMIEQGYNAERMFRKGNDFYTSMGLKPVPDTFWNRSMLEKPTDGREVICHATSWDMYDGKDFRIRMCTRITFEDFQTVHHELGHIQYQMQYADQPLSFRDGANDGFHEAVGELMSMSFSTTKHLNTIGLLNVPDDAEVDMNFLLFQALNTISTLPFHLVQDTWRWKLFAGKAPAKTLNSDYWADKARVVGVTPPVPRDDTSDLDITALFHVCNDFDMIRYFMRTFYQYQFNEALCKASNHQGPLYKCDFYNSTAAGDALAKMLKLGASRPWQDALEALTGQRDIDAQPMLNYFQPLADWLKAENEKNGEFIGWTVTKEEMPLDKQAGAADENSDEGLSVNDLSLDKQTAEVLAPLIGEFIKTLQNIRL